MSNTYICTLDVVGAARDIDEFLDDLRSTSSARGAVMDGRPWVSCIADGSTEGVPEPYDRADGLVSAGLEFGAEGEMPVAALEEESRRFPRLAFVLAGHDPLACVGEAYAFAGGREVANHVVDEDDYSGRLDDPDEGPTEEEEAEMMASLVEAVTAAAKGSLDAPAPRVP